MKIRGIGASPGIALGRVLLMEEASPEGAAAASIEASAAPAELARLREAIGQAAAEVAALRDELKEKGREHESEIFDGHLMLLEDEELVDRAKQAIEEDLLSAESAVAVARDEIAAMLESLEDEYLRERAADIRDVCGRIIGKLSGRSNLLADSGNSEPVILVAGDLTPSHTATLDPQAVAGFVTLQGGRTSHSAIIARSIGIPAIVGMGGSLASLQGGEFVIVDGETGELHVEPDAATIEQYQARRASDLAKRQELQALMGAESVSLDGVHVELAANIGSPADAEAAKAKGAEGVGLFRTEFLYMGRDTLPSEDEQYEAYVSVAKTFGPNAPVVIRTMDIGGDKELPILDLPKEDNPFLGYRAIRISLDRHDLFKTQLRAVLRASAYGNLKVMFPMIATLAEWRAAKAVVEQCKDELRAEGVAFNEAIECGIMIEIPAAALLADRFASEVDFFSIGTNDLTQYTFAADRMNEKLTALNDPLQPAVLHLIERVIKAARAEGKWVGMCGEMAGQPHAVPLLLGLGLQEFSMSAGSVLQARALIRKLDQSRMAQLAAEALELESPEAIRAFVEERVPEIRL
ncbi:phosphotransferase system enzyme I (PtsI) [Paenibacillus phyllosphaerae]|uniref:Phosphoenolpyruvate-protein phosphotransferase n=1 Tax=Paenibacillus phyllosphaerae TaxID=274593 RepID=A0A7W5ATQ4_9BACL|nr:phosphoenolpyruvate--protein phosphotransferase [Paenibacillus phyllosphaerae]MBB3108605.1 phosphotransferase system enzyme I (PtsI) [Paenibacillus phyllosphaerae]